MVPGDLLDGRSPHQVGPTVTHIGHVEVITPHNGSDDGRTNPLICRVAGRLVINLGVGHLDGPFQAAGDIGRRVPVILLNDLFYRQLASLLSAWMTAHSVGHHVEPALLL